MSLRQKMPLKQAIPLGLPLSCDILFWVTWHTATIITGAVVSRRPETIWHSYQIELLQNAMLVAGLITLLQLFRLVRSAAGSGYQPRPALRSSVYSTAWLLRWAAVFWRTAPLWVRFDLRPSVRSVGCFLKPLVNFPSVVTGTVVLSIDLSIRVGVNSFGGGSSARRTLVPWKICCLLFLS